MLKKIAILTAAAGMLSTSMAVLAEGPTVYGRVAFGFKSISGETDADDSQRIDDHLGSRLGVKGSNDLGNGMSVDYLLEYGAGEKLGLRHANMTLNGSFGQFRLGQQTGVLYRYIGSNSDQSWALGGKEWYAIAKNNMNSNHNLRMSNIAAYRFGAGPGGDDPITFDIQIQGKDMTGKTGGVTIDGTKYDAELRLVDQYGNPVTNADNIEDVTLTLTKGTPNEEKDDDETIDSVTIGAATSLGPVKLQLAYVDENGSKATNDRSPNLVSFGFRAPLGSAEVRGHVTQVDADVEGRDDNKAWGLLVMNDFGGGYFGMIGVGSYTDGGKDSVGTVAVTGGEGPDGTAGTVDDIRYKARKDPVHKNAGDMTNAYVSLTKSLGGGLSVIAEYSTVSKTVSDFTAIGDVDTTITDPGARQAAQNASLDDDKETTNKFLLSIMQTF